MRTLKALFFTALLTLSVSGCWALAPPSPAAQSKHWLDRFFKDPKAQALALAAEQNNVEEVRRLIKEEGINPDLYFSTNDDMPLLAWPIYTQSPEGLRALLENGADPNIARPYLGNPERSPRNNDNAMVWATKQEDPIYLRLLLDHGGDPDTRNVNNEALLFQAFIWHNQKQNVKLLVERGADLNANSFGVGTVLEHYMTFSDPEIAYWLLLQGADPELDYQAEKAYRRKDSPAIEAAFWRPPVPAGHAAQRKIQQWMVAKGYKRPPMSEYFRDIRISCGYPVKEEDIPLILPPEYPSDWPGPDHLCKPSGKGNNVKE